MGEIFNESKSRREDFLTALYAVALIGIVSLVVYAVYSVAIDFIHLLGETASIGNYTTNPYFW